MSLALLYDIKPGYQVVLLLALIGVLVALAGLVLLRRERQQQRLAPRQRREPPVAALTAPNGPNGPNGPDEPNALAQSLQGVERLIDLRHDLRVRLGLAQATLEAQRADVESAVALMKRAALDMRLPDTLFEAFESLRRLPAKSAEAQAADLQWHAQVGIVPERVQVFDDGVATTVVTCSIAGRPLCISGRNFALSHARFDELTLFDGPDEAVAVAVAVVRMRLSDDRRQVLERAVVSYRPGDWVAVLVACRAQMDERHEQLLLQARYRDVETLRTRFGLAAAAPRQVSL